MKVCVATSREMENCSCDKLGCPGCNFYVNEMEYTNKKREILFINNFINYRCFIISYGEYPCAYIEILDKSHPMYRNGGLTLDLDSPYGGISYIGASLPQEESKHDSYFIGWDYNHGFDFNYRMDIEMPGLFGGQNDEFCKKHTVKEIYNNILEVISELEACYE